MEVILRWAWWLLSYVFWAHIHFFVLTFIYSVILDPSGQRQVQRPVRVPGRQVEAVGQHQVHQGSVRVPGREVQAVGQHIKQEDRQHWTHYHGWHEWQWRVKQWSWSDVRAGSGGTCHSRTRSLDECVLDDHAELK